MKFHSRHVDPRGSAAAPIRRRWLAMLLLMSLDIATGCNTPHYRAATMPDELRAQPTRAHEVNLSNMPIHGSSSSLIGAGDLVEITIASGGEEGKLEPLLARVDRNGNVNVPLVGPVAVAGIEPFEAAERVAAASVERGIYRQPSVVIKVDEAAYNQVTVLGAVKEPGVKKLPHGSSDVLNAVAAAGGFTEEASTNVEVMRHGGGSFQASAGAGGQVATASYESPLFPSSASGGEAGRAVGGAAASYRLDLAQATTHKPADYRIGDGDVVMVHPEKKRVIFVSGLVNKPDRFEITKDQDVYVLDAIAMAGGIKSPVANKVYVIRRVAGQVEPAVIEISIAKAKQDGNENLRLAPGDMVSVESTALTNTVDTLTTFFRMTLGVGGNLTFF